MATIQGVYVALFGRPADPAGLAYFNGVTNNGADLTAIGDLASTQEYKDRFAGKSNVEIVSSIYQSLFNRAPEAAGLNFFVDALNKGTLNINNIAIAILDGAQGSDKTTLDNKLAAADQFTAALDTPVEVASYVGTDAANVGVAYLAAQGAAAPAAGTGDAGVLQLLAGNTITLAAGASVVSTDAGTLANADKVSTVKDDTIEGGANWDATDSIDGSTGTDTLNAAPAANVTVGAGKLKNVEVLNLGATAAATVNVAEAKELTSVVDNASTAALTVEGIALGTGIGVKGSVTAASTFVFADATGTSDAATLTLDGATSGGGVVVDNIETLNIANTGTSSATVTAAKATAVNVSGSGELTLVADTAEATAITNSSTGKVVVNLDAANKLETYTGSGAVDEVSTDAAANTANQTINTGAGADIINVDGTAGATKSVTVTGGADSDKIVIETALANITDITDSAKIQETLITVSDFNKAEDVIDVTIAGAKATLNNFDVGSISSAANLKAALEAAAAAIGANASAVFVYGGDTYVFNNDATATLGAGDGLVKIAGVTDVADLTASNFLI